jgi:ribosomal protein S18 acetylase RimI-like enzyme
MRLATTHSGPRLDDVRALFREYHSWLGVDLCFQSFEEELQSLPGKYGPPEGRLLLALDGERAAGVVALRKIGEGICEMKRLFVRPEFRCRGLGRQLAAAVIDAGRELGYREMKLDTVPKLVEAIALYRSLGFVEVAPYYHNPLEGALYFGKVLAPTGPDEP